MALFRFGFDKPGPGVEKDTPPKKGLARWWEVLVRDFFAILLGNMALIICGLPLAVSVLVFWTSSVKGAPWMPALLLNLLFAVPVGPALAAVHHLTLRMCRDIPFFAWHEFKKAYRQNFKQGSIAMVAFAAVGNVLLFSMCLTFWTDEIGLSYIAVLAVGAYVWFSLINTVFQQIALLDKDLPGIFMNGVLMLFMSGWRSAAVTLADVALLVLFVEKGWLLFPLAVMGLFGVAIMTGDLVMYPRLEQIFIKKEEPAAQEHLSVKEEWQLLVDAEENPAEKRK
ncbi:MAG: YesL family protein [Oscillospiraceae bacterium]|nr:YesL family protein [Oscillospiraceae bacterium]